MCLLVSLSEPLFSHLQSGDPAPLCRKPGARQSTEHRTRGTEKHNRWQLFLFLVTKPSSSSLDYSSRESINRFQEQGAGKQSWLCPGSDINELDGPEAPHTHFPAPRPGGGRGAPALAPLFRAVTSYITKGTLHPNSPNTTQRNSTRPYKGMRHWPGYPPNEPEHLVPSERRQTQKAT